MLINRILKWGYNNPKKLFLIDGCGAILSAIILGIIMPQFVTLFGIPKSTLYFLATLPCLFAIYDFYCYFKINKNFKKYIKAIAYVNIIYCCLSILLAIHHIQVITNLGWVYIIIEILIVFMLAMIEIHALKEKREQLQETMKKLEAETKK